MKPGIERIEKTLAPFLTEQNGRRYMPKENIDAAIQAVTNLYSDCFCEVSPHKNFPVFTFKMSRARKVFFEVTIL